MCVGIPATAAAQVEVTIPTPPGEVPQTQIEPEVIAPPVMTQEIPSPIPPCTGPTQAQQKRYALRVLTNWQRPLPSRKAQRRLKRMQARACSAKAERNMARVERRLWAYAPKPPAGTLAHCILSSESGFSPAAGNGSHWNIAQWDGPTWRSHLALLPRRVRARISKHPSGASYREALAVFVAGFARYRCAPWCPYDPC